MITLFTLRLFTFLTTSNYNVLRIQADYLDDIKIGIFKKSSLLELAVEELSLPVDNFH